MLVPYSPGRCAESDGASGLTTTIGGVDDALSADDLRSGVAEPDEAGEEDRCEDEGLCEGAEIAGEW
jgi:hypothetical protein